MEDNIIQVSAREIQSNGRISVCLKANKYAKVGSVGIIKGTCVALDGTEKTAQIEWEIVESTDKNPKRRMMILPNPVTVWVDWKNDEQSELWEEMTDHICFSDLPIEDMVRKISYDPEPISADGILITKVNERFPEFQRGLSQCRTNKQKDTYKEYVEQQINHSALFDVTNIHFPAPVEGDEFYDSEECSAFIDHTKFRCYNNDFINICYRSTQARIEHCEKKQNEDE